MMITIMYGSARKARVGIRAARFMRRMLQERGHEVELIEPFTHPFPMLDLRYHDYEEGKAPALMESVASTLKRSDGVVVVSGEYNHGIPPALKNIIDHFMQEYFFKPSAIVTYSIGAFGGVRAAMALRMVLPEVGMPSIPSTFPIPHVQDAFDEQGNTVQPQYEDRVKRFLDEFEWYMEACAAQRKKGLPY